MRAPRSAALGAVASLLLLATLIGGPPRPEASAAKDVNLRPAAAVAWPPSTGLLLAEVVTGGASASDEYVEITNAGAVPVDLAGTELVYVTSSGSSVTRKVTWADVTLLATGQHLLAANALGVYAAIADVTYSGGLAATGGALVLRPVGGAPIDAVGWGGATNAFVEGAVAAAPSAGQSIERRPGGNGGNVIDTNQNGADWTGLAAPIPQNRAADPVPGPPAPPTPTPTPVPTPVPTPIPTPTPEPTPTPTPAPTPTPTATPVPAISIAAARSAPDGTVVTVEGVLSAPLGVLEAGRGGFLQDGTAGIAIYAASALEPMAAGSLVRVAGSVDDRYGQRTIRIDAAPVLLASGLVPVAVPATTGTAVEPLEGVRLVVQGTVVDAPAVLADGPAITLDDGSGPLRVVFVGDASGTAPSRGSLVSVSGPLGQRDSSGTGAAGYRLFVVDPLDLSEEPAPQPSPGPSAEPSPSPSPDPGTNPTPTPEPTSSAAPTLSPSPVPSAEPITIADARGAPIGATVRVRGVVTAEPGRVGLASLGVVADASGSICIRFPVNVAPPRGALLEIAGPLADPYGQLEIRPLSAGARLIGTAPLVNPIPIEAASLGELVEARLVSLDATLDAPIVRASSGELELRLIDATGAAFRARDESQRDRAHRCTPRRPAAPRWNRRPASVGTRAPRWIPRPAARRG
jgi:outer membrane biosynthesis protein TonB